MTEKSGGCVRVDAGKGLDPIPGSLLERVIAWRFFNMGLKLKDSSVENVGRTYGYGKVDDNGLWEYPLFETPFEV